MFKMLIGFLIAMVIFSPQTFTSWISKVNWEQKINNGIDSVERTARKIEPVAKRIVKKLDGIGDSKQGSK